MRWLERAWYRSGLTGLTLLLLPLTWVYEIVIKCRRFFYRLGVFKSKKIFVPVIVVGNISVGGTGKSPMVIFLLEYLKSQGYKPGVVMRGYKGEKNQAPLRVEECTPVIDCGDEAKMIVMRTQCPLVICRDRVAAANALLDECDVDVILSDDGLQHYALKRDIEIIMVDAQRRFGNQYCLPSGPLREPIHRILEADFVVVTGGHANDPFYTELQIAGLVNVNDAKTPLHASMLVGQRVYAVAGIGNPDRFFHTLLQLGADVIERRFNDHHHFSEADFAGLADGVIVMTEKDAIKCQGFVPDSACYLKMHCQPNENFLQHFSKRLELIIELKH